MIKLKYDQSPDGLDEAVVPIRWCLEQPLIDEIMRGRTRKDPPHLLLVVWNEKTRDEQRMLVPLEEPLRYVSFVSHGINKVWAIAFTRESRDWKEIDRRYMQKLCGNFSTTLVSRHGDLYFETLPPETSYAELTFNVRPDLFAKEPAAWEKWWVNYWWDGEMPAEECDFRKRRIPAYFLQTWMLPLWWLVKFAVHLVTAFFFRVLLFRPVRWYFVFRPWRGWPCDIPSHRSEWFFDRHPAYLPFMPLAMVLVGSALFVTNLQTLLLPIFRGLEGYLLSVAISPVFMYALLFSFLGIAKLFEKPYSAWKESRVEMTRRNNLPLALRNPEVMQALVCDGVPKQARIKDLPPKVVTLRMRFDAVKKNVCRPFSK